MKTKHIITGISAILTALLVTCAPCLGKDAAVLALQQKLAAAGFDPKGIDGKWGAGTESALKAYQAANDLPQTGRLEPGSETAKKLGVTVKDPVPQNEKQIPKGKLKPGWGEFKGQINIALMELGDGTTQVMPFNVHTAEGKITYMHSDGKIVTITVTGVSVQVKDNNSYYLYGKRDENSSACFHAVNIVQSKKTLALLSRSNEPRPETVR